LTVLDLFDQDLGACNYQPADAKQSPTYARRA
jgi:hypothetical protein